MPANIIELNNAENILLNFILPRIQSDRGDKFIRFVQIGANIGNVDGDPIFQFVNQNLWKGLLIEPLPHVFEELKRQLSHVDDLMFANCAISNETGTKTLYYPEEQTVLASFDPNLVMAHLPDKGTPLKEQEVRCDTLENILTEHGIDYLDVLVTDTEGHDAQILLGTDFSKITPHTILFEAKHLSNEDRAAAAQHLEKFGYLVIEMGANTLALKPTAETLDFCHLMKDIFAQFRMMEARSMLIVQQLINFANTISQNTPRG